MKRHSLRDANFCFFKYDGKVDFKVKIFDGKTCVKLLPSDIKPSQGLNELGHPKRSGKDSHKKARARVDKMTEKMLEDDHSHLSFVKVMKYYVINKSSVLKISCWFIDKHFSRDGDTLEILLENKEGRQWQVNLLPKKFAFSAGWALFVKENQIEEGDVCTFQFMGGLKLLVHISRKGGSSQPQAPEMLADRRKCHIPEGAQKVAQVQHHTKRKGKEQRLEDSDAEEHNFFAESYETEARLWPHKRRAKEDERAKKGQAATKHVLQVLEQQAEVLKQMKEENERMMQMVKVLGS